VIPRSTGPTPGPFISKRDIATGEELWATIVDLDPSLYIKDMSLGSDGQLWVAGFTDQSLARPNIGQFDAYIAQLSSANGSILWEYQFGSTANEWAYAVVELDGNVYIGGDSDGDFGVGAGDAYVQKLDANRDVVWTQRIGSVHDTLKSIDVNAEGDVVAGGSTGNSAYYGARFATETGSVEWMEEFRGETRDEGFGAAFAPDGHVWVLGSATTYVSGAYVNPRNGQLVKLTSDGGYVWDLQFDSTGLTTSTVTPRQLSVDASGNPLVCGIVRRDPNISAFDGFAHRFDRINGVITWNFEIESEWSPAVNDIAAGPDGTILVVGRVRGDYATTSAGEADCFFLRAQP
jgi:hypothetical protein